MTMNKVLQINRITNAFKIKQPLPEHSPDPTSPSNEKDPQPSSSKTFGKAVFSGMNSRNQNS